MSLNVVMKNSGNSPPGMLPFRYDMMLTDLERTSKYWGIPLKPPPLLMEWAIEYRTTDAMRVLLVLEERDYDLMVRAAREMWLRLWYRSEKIFEEVDFRAVLNAIGVDDADDVIRKSREPKYKTKLVENTEKLEKAYGAPWITVLTADGAEHQFFGSDRFPLIAELIGRPHPLPRRLRTTPKL